MSIAAPVQPLFIGLMSGTSLDGVDGVLVAFPAPAAGSSQHADIAASVHLPFAAALRDALLALQSSGLDEIQREALAGIELTRLYATAVEALLRQARLPAAAIRAIGVHGQTIRHRPELGYTRQTNQPALLAELTGIDVIADFRSRDVAAGGQGAPLVPAFHQAMFGGGARTRVVLNIGGISNLSILPASAGTETVTGFDTGPGNVLMDAWIAHQRGARYDADGAWAASGRLLPALLENLRSEPFFALPPPKSTGRDLFHLAWLQARLAAFPGAAAADVQATLAALTAGTIADAVAAHAADAETVYVGGGGAYNGHLMRQLAAALRARALTADVTSTDALGVAPDQVEALAFAWLAQRFEQRQPGNLAAVTGAGGARILGALYPGH